MNDKKPNKQPGKRGGKRPGAGRPTTPGARVVPKSIKVSQPVADYLSDNGTGLIEDLIRASKPFREWEKR